MKKTLLVTLLLIPFLGISQTTKPVDGFLGIKFGSRRAEVITALNAKGCIFNTKVSTESKIVFDNVSLGHRKSIGLTVEFVNDKAYQASFFFKDELETKTIDYYNDLVNDINGIYGAGVSSKKFKEPYADGDGYEVQAISHGNADYQTFWKASNNNLLFTIINAKLHIQLTYRDYTLNAEAESNQKAKEKADF